MNSEPEDGTVLQARNFQQCLDEDTGFASHGTVEGEMGVTGFLTFSRTAGQLPGTLVLAWRYLGSHT